ncbi:hypothetical protein [Microbacterium sp.]|uniref:hypothetical protein n=1 Tax=Microbacterium sp. TaxID=51671 RepID=UPI002600F5B1|nr:hypothetical protein [Microbacterium sp.]
MSTPDQPDSPQMTRRQLRELRNTASTPIITPEHLDEAATVTESPAPVVAPLPRAAEPATVAEAPPPAADIDLHSPALTRRRARQQERIRTASVPIVSEFEPVSASATDAVLNAAVKAPGNPGAARMESVVAPLRDDEPTERSRGEAITRRAHPDESAGRPVIAPTFGSGLLSGRAVEVEVPASFDQLLSRGSAATGSLAATNALILSQTPDTGSFVGPVTATGEVLITGTFNLPDHFGATGTVPGMADGKDVDAVLVDGELPASSSPSPIAASAAISTIKSAEDIIKPPAPEKGGRLMLTLVITAGALALALTGVLIVALVTGAFS